MSGENGTWRERAHRSLSGLTAAQKFSAGVLVAVMIATGVWLAHSSVSGPMEPVLDQAFADADVSQISHRLSEKKVPHEVREGKVYVPADRKMEVLSDLIYSDTLTGNTESGFDALAKGSSIFDSPSKTEKMFNLARQKTLASVIGQFRGVRNATVMIDPTNERHINGGSITPAAWVNIQTRGNEASPRQLASAAVNALTGAVSTMSRERVKVTIDGASYNLGSDEFGDDLLERRQQCEQAQVTKVRQLLSYIPDVLVSVSVDLNVQTVEEEKHTFDPESSLSLKREEETRVDLPAPSEEPAPAVLANSVPPLGDKTPDAPTALNVRGENTKTQYTVLSGETVSKSKTPAGKETVLSASVVVPRAYFAQIYRRGAVKAAEPTDALLQPVIDAQLLKIRHLVRTSLGLKNESDVTVEVYDDGSSTAATPVVAVLPRQEAVIVPPLGTMWNHRTQWGLAIFGAVTLVLVSTMLRRGSGAMAAPQPVDLSDEPARPSHASLATRTPRLDFGSDGDGDNHADHNGDFQDVHDDGHRVADLPRADHREASLLRQVRELAAAHPEEAARVMRQWIYQG